LLFSGGEPSSGSGSDDEQRQGAAAAAGNGSAAAAVPAVQREDWMTVPMASSALFKQQKQEPKPAEVSSGVLLL
jgi:hypothetical protein